MKNAARRVAHIGERGELMQRANMGNFLTDPASPLPSIVTQSHPHLPPRAGPNFPLRNCPPSTIPKANDQRPTTKDQRQVGQRPTTDDQRQVGSISPTFATQGWPKFSIAELSTIDDPEGQRPTTDDRRQIDQQPTTNDRLPTTDDQGPKTNDHRQIGRRPSTVAPRQLPGNHHR
jgi:hypothetical protein